MRGKRQRPAIYPPTAAKAEPTIARRRQAIQQAIALEQRAGAERALMVVQAAKWDGHRFVIPRPDSVLGLAEVPAEFTRDLFLGRVQAAIRERADFWLQQVEAGPGFVKHGVPGLKVSYVAA